MRRWACVLVSPVSLPRFLAKYAQSSVVNKNADYSLMYKAVKFVLSPEDDTNFAGLFLNVRRSLESTIEWELPRSFSGCCVNLQATNHSREHALHRKDSLTATDYVLAAAVFIKAPWHQLRPVPPRILYGDRTISEGPAACLNFRRCYIPTSRHCLLGGGPRFINARQSALSLQKWNTVVTHSVVGRARSLIGRARLWHGPRLIGRDRKISRINFRTSRSPVAQSVGAPPIWGVGGSRFESQDKIDFKHVYAEVTFAVGSEFVRDALVASEPIARKQEANPIPPGVRKSAKTSNSFSTNRCLGAAVVEWLALPPPTNANRVQSLAGSLPCFRMWESCRTMPLASGFSRRSPPPIHSGAVRFDHLHRLLKATQISPLANKVLPGQGTLPINGGRSASPFNL
ncbi:hypothetical protein PR048_031310 [Dryococelus australis]|uniref:Uncharacterized protein n=1 Tax=Dryococelus australis TaxID=614101 RepID=A0ABQ9G7Z6_9NEOP|nr:hypothetical protein PR048_031310 [Dryococelus australis]